MKRAIAIALATAFLSASTEPGLLVKAFKIAKTLPAILQQAERTIQK